MFEELSELKEKLRLALNVYFGDLQEEQIKITVCDQTYSLVCSLEDYLIAGLDPYRRLDIDFSASVKVGKKPTIIFNGSVTSDVDSKLVLRVNEFYVSKEFRGRKFSYIFLQVIKILAKHAGHKAVLRVTKPMAENNYSNLLLKLGFERLEIPNNGNNIEVFLLRL